MDKRPNFGDGYTGGERQAQAELPPATARFDREMQDLTQRRGAQYGHPFVDFSRAAAIKAILADCPDPRLRHILDMLAVKMARLIHTPDHFDSWLDIAGYARTACMVIDAGNLKTEVDHGKD